jgi:hypothetical protein
MGVGVGHSRHRQRLPTNVGHIGVDAGQTLINHTIMLVDVRDIGMRI